MARSSGPTLGRAIPAHAVWLGMLLLGCSEPSDPPEETGAIDISVSTSGPILLTERYRISIDGEPVSAIGPQGHVVLSDLAAGRHDVEIADIPAGCAVSGTTSRTVAVPAGGTAPVTFLVACEGPISVRIITRTSGTGVDPDGYRVEMSGVGEHAIGISDTIEFDHLPGGPRTVTLTGVSPNCLVTGGASLELELFSGTSTTVVFEVTCAAPDAPGTIVVTTSTTLVFTAPSVPSFTVLLDGIERLPVSDGSPASFSPLPPGEHTVRLELPSNCGVYVFLDHPIIPQITVTLLPGTTRPVGFPVRCR